MTTQSDNQLNVRFRNQRQSISPDRNGPVRLRTGSDGDVQSVEDDAMSNPLEAIFDDDHDHTAMTDIVDLLTRTRSAITASDIELSECERNFRNIDIPDDSEAPADYYRWLTDHVLPYVVNTSSPRFIGHMTSVLPAFTHDLSLLISRLNQNVVKIETSKVITFLEREAVAKLHRAFFALPNEFYSRYIQDPNVCLGLVTSGGTVANTAALWCARNRQLGPDVGFAGVASRGLHRALLHYGFEDAVILGTRRAHYSLRKAASLLGLGTDNIIYVSQSGAGVMDINALRVCIHDCRQRRYAVIAIIANAGATETGSIDPLREIGAIARDFNIHFHVDAAWGGPLVFSRKFSHLLDGVDTADTITVCGHKQLYLPVGLSLCLFRDPRMTRSTSTTSNYQARENSHDIGKFSPEGSRPAVSLLLHAAFHLLGRKRYEELIDGGIAKAQYMRHQISQDDAFELISGCDLNIVNYRYIPKPFRGLKDRGELGKDENRVINEVNTRLQERQFIKGKTFVSRTLLELPQYNTDAGIVVLRAVLANPMTSAADIDFVLADQKGIADAFLNDCNN